MELKSFADDLHYVDWLASSPAPAKQRPSEPVRRLRHEEILPTIVGTLNVPLPGDAGTPSKEPRDRSNGADHHASDGPEVAEQTPNLGGSAGAVNHRVLLRSTSWRRQLSLQLETDPTALVEVVGLLAAHGSTVSPARFAIRNVPCSLGHRRPGSLPNAR